MMAQEVPGAMTLLECVVNVSEGRDLGVLAALSDAAGPYLLDIHTDADHHRSVFTLAGPGDRVELAVRSLAVAAVERIDISTHHGAHPRIGALDVVPWVPLSVAPGGRHLVDGSLGDAVAARDRFVEWAVAALDLPVFLYGPLAAGRARTLPEVRRQAWDPLAPDAGPRRPHSTAGAVAVGARPVLVAYNLWLAEADIDRARQIAAETRGPLVRTLALAVGDHVQVSCNLIAPWGFGPAAAFDAVASRTAVARAELVGLLPRAVLARVPSHRHAELDLAPSRTIEARLERAGLDGGRFSTSPTEGGNHHEDSTNNDEGKSNDEGNTTDGEGPV